MILGVSISGILSATIGVFSDSLIAREKIRAAGKKGLAALGSK